MELVISISRVTRFARVGGNALGVKLPTDIPHKSTEKSYINQRTPKPRTLARVPNLLHKRRLARVAAQLKQRPRLLAHGGLSLAIALIVLVGGLNTGESNLATQYSQPVGPLSALAQEGGYGGVVDETASAYIAAGVAQEVDLPLAEQVVSEVQEMTSQGAYSSTTDTALAKPQVLSTEGALARGVQKYVVKEGDSVDSIAAQFNVSADTVRWANNLTGTTQPSAGQTLTILPVSGVLHTVSPTDTPEGLALVYQTSADQIVRYNDAEISGLQPGTTIIIPGGSIVASAQTPSASFVASSGSYIVNNSFRPSYAGNGYDYGWCTWHAANRRAAAGQPIPSNWGNAISWRYNAASSGNSIGSTPQAGAVVYHNNSGGWGHVAYVEQVYADGSARFSDMNYPYWGKVTERVVPASEMGNYSFIY